MTITTQKCVTAYTKSAMAARGLRMAAISEALGLSPRSVSAKLAGGVKWSVDELDTLAAFWGTTPEMMMAEGRRWLQTDPAMGFHVDADTSSRVMVESRLVRQGGRSEFLERAEAGRLSTPWATDEGSTDTVEYHRADQVVVPLQRRPAAAQAAAA